MQTVATAARGRVVNRTVQIIAPEEPLKSAPRFFAPILLTGKPVGLKTGRDHGLRLYRLLVETGTLAAPRIKTVRADRDKMPSLCVRALKTSQPSQGLQSGFGHFRIGHRLAA